MGEHRSLVDACQAVGLECRCEHLHHEPRFRVSIDQTDATPLLSLVIRNDDSIVPRPLHADPNLPAVLFEVAEQTVCREEVLEIWLPCTDRHRFVAWQENGLWELRQLGGVARVETADEAVRLVRDQSGGDSACA